MREFLFVVMVRVLLTCATRSSFSFSMPCSSMFFPTSISSSRSLASLLIPGILPQNKRFRLIAVKFCASTTTGKTSKNLQNNAMFVVLLRSLILQIILRLFNRQWPMASYYVDKLKTFCRRHIFCWISLLLQNEDIWKQTMFLKIQLCWDGVTS